MEIISHGDLFIDKDHKYIVHCSFCGCVFFCKKSELDMRHPTKTLGSIFCSIKCPECNNLIPVNINIDNYIIEGDEPVG